MAHGATFFGVLREIALCSKLLKGKTKVPIRPTISVKKQLYFFIMTKKII
jgi:hypothetical protein